MWKERLCERRGPVRRCQKPRCRRGLEQLSGDGTWSACAGISVGEPVRVKCEVQVRLLMERGASSTFQALQFPR
jgi:hypothetical protein